MKEFWSVLGLASIDKQFRLELQADAQSTLDRYHFRLSRWETHELRRILTVKEVVEALDTVHDKGWLLHCAPAITDDPLYDHTLYSPESKESA